MILFLIAQNNPHHLHIASFPRFEVRKISARFARKFPFTCIGIVLKIYVVTRVIFLADCMILY